MTIPCDTGGLTACVYWPTFQDSPGIPVAWADQHALDLYQQIDAYGWDLVSTLHTESLSAYEAEALFVRLAWLTDHLPGLRAQYFGGQGQQNT